MPSGIIIKGIGGFYYVVSDEVIYECRARGIFRRREMTPLPGDRVTFSILDDEKRVGSLDEILPRDSLLERPAVANVNQVIVMIAIKSPPPDFLLLDKLLVTAEKKNIQVIICINKIDLDVDGEHEKICRAYTPSGYKLILSSLKTNQGFNELKDVLKGKITVFAGQSGVGKSTVLNRVMSAYMMQTGVLSSKIERGKHTTRHAELVKLEDGGYVVDTPGFSSFELSDIDYDALQDYYPEFMDIAGNCRFSGCSHVSEPECRVKEAVNAGFISTERYERYITLYNYLKQCSNNKYK